MCFGCTDNGRIAYAIVVAVVCFALATTVGLIWPGFTQGLIEGQLKLTKGTIMFSNWVERPIPLYMEVYLYNWSNVANIENWQNEKPRFEEFGPYVFEERAKRVNLDYKEDDTVVGFNQAKTWYFRRDLSKGSLSDRIYNVNPIAATVSWGKRLLPEIPELPIVINAFLEQFTTFYIGKTAGEWLFDGFNDGVLDWLSETIASGDLPPEIIPGGIPIEEFDKFGWFYGRNNSITADGRFEMFTGKDDISKLGYLKTWNGNETVNGLRGECSKIAGTTGELWAPNIDKDQDATLFIPDVCRKLSFKRSGELKKFGVKGLRWVADDSLFDNGEKYPEAECWCADTEENCPVLKAGVYDASECNYGAPAFVSFPHFYLADSSYLDAVDGLSPSRAEHESYIGLEPNFGIPLEVKAKLQVNLFLKQDDELDWFKNVPNLYVPMFWFNQRADLTEELSGSVKLLLNVTELGIWITWTAVAIGIVSTLLAGFFIYRKRQNSKGITSYVANEIIKE